MTLFDIYLEGIPLKVRIFRNIASVLTVLSLVMGLLASGAIAADREVVDPVVSATILAKLRSGRGDLPYGPVKFSPVKGLYQVDVPNGPTLFVSGDGNYFVAGDMYQVKPGMFVNLQEQTRADERVSLLAAVPQSEQIIFSPKGERLAYINVFTDVDCVFCRKLHKEVPALNARGIEVRYLAYPRAGLGSAGFKKLATAWCADDPGTTLTRFKNKESVDLKVCANNPVAKQYSLGSRLGVTGTPALVLADGTLIPGYRTADELAKVLGVN